MNLPPAYVLMCYFRPNISRPNLVTALSTYVEKTVKHGGIVRQIRNNGIGPTPQKIKGRFAQERFEDAQIVTMEFFSTGEAVQNISKELRADTRLLKHHLIRADDALLPRVTSISKKELNL
mmetsp:Transcript_16050/g.18160  ORF Transcript_16050/g.18160 Transcript_16050/m.18160 type:complete len:121 (+) Transcript_16050:176-538(+)